MERRCLQCHCAFVAVCCTAPIFQPPLPRVRALIQTVNAMPSPEAVASAIPAASGIILLRTALFHIPEARYSYLVANPFLTFRSYGPRCDLSSANGPATTLFGNPWNQLQSLISRYELLDDIDLPFPLGG